MLLRIRPTFERWTNGLMRRKSGFSRVAKCSSIPATTHRYDAGIHDKNGGRPKDADNEAGQSEKR